MSDTLVWVAGITQAITAIVAVAALAVSIISIRRQQRDRSPQLKVRGSLTTLMDSNFEVVEYVYMITVANHSTTPVKVTGLYVWDTPQWKMVFPNIRGEQDKQLPCKLEPWESASWWVNYESLREALRRQGHQGKHRIKLEAVDGTGRSHFKRTAILLNTSWWRKTFRG